jgi:hypothetical protein
MTHALPMPREARRVLLASLRLLARALPYLDARQKLVRGQHPSRIVRGADRRWSTKMRDGRQGTVTSAHTGKSMVTAGRWHGCSQASRQHRWSRLQARPLSGCPGAQPGCSQPCSGLCALYESAPHDLSATRAVWC